MRKGNHRPTKKAALVVLSDSANYHRPVDISTLQAVAIQQIAQIRLLERESALRAVLCGFALHRIKATLKHGQFLPWIKNDLKGAGRSQANNYMRLAAVAVEKTRATKPELLAIPGDQTELSLDTAEGYAGRMMEKLTKFVGQKSLNELLRDHGIKDGKKPTKPDDDTDDDGEGETEKTEPDPEVTAQIWREGISEWIESGRYQLLEEAPNVKLDPTQVRNIEGVLTKLLADFRETHRHTLKG